MCWLGRRFSARRLEENVEVPVLVGAALLGGMCMIIVAASRAARIPLWVMRPFLDNVRAVERGGYGVAAACGHAFERSNRFGRRVVERVHFVMPQSAQSNLQIVARLLHVGNPSLYRDGAQGFLDRVAAGAQGFALFAAGAHGLALFAAGAHGFALRADGAQGLAFWPDGPQGLVRGRAGPQGLGAQGLRAAWATWIVSGDLVTELDAREMPDTWQFPKASLGCAEQWCPDGFRAGNEVFALDPEMTAWAYALSKDVPLADDPKARQAMQNYPDAVARGAPFVTTCAILGVNDFIHGTLMSEWSSWWVSQWTDGKDAYCMSGDEEGGIFTSLQRLEEAKRIDMRRVMALRVATDLDRQYPGQSAGESLAEALDSTFGFVGLENIYRVGSPVVQDIVAHWDQWEAGPPPLPR